MEKKKFRNSMMMEEENNFEKNSSNLNKSFARSLKNYKIFSKLLKIKVSVVQTMNFMPNSKIKKLI